MHLYRNKKCPLLAGFISSFHPSPIIFIPVVWFITFFSQSVSSYKQNYSGGRRSCIWSLKKCNCLWWSCRAQQPSHFLTNAEGTDQAKNFWWLSYLGLSLKMLFWFYPFLNHIWLYFHSIHSHFGLLGIKYKQHKVWCRTHKISFQSWLYSPFPHF